MGNGRWGGDAVPVAHCPLPIAPLLRSGLEDARIADVGGGEGQQRQMAGALQRGRQPPLMTGTGAGLTPWLDLAAVRDKPPQPCRFLVVDHVDLIHAELADLPPRNVPAAATATVRRGAGRTAARGAAFPCRRSPVSGLWFRSCCHVAPLIENRESQTESWATVILDSRLPTADFRH